MKNDEKGSKCVEYNSYLVAFRQCFTLTEVCEAEWGVFQIWRRSILSLVVVIILGDLNQPKNIKATASVVEI